MVTYKFTEHSKRRFRERFPEKVASNNIILSLKRCLDEATLNKSIHNNTRFISQLYEKHGFESMQFYTNESVVFVCRGENLVTVYDLKDSVFNIETSKRFRKK